jgi:molybdopterin converting factor small subunit
VPEVLLFAQARDAAGCSSVSIAGQDVSAILQGLTDRFGAPIEEVLDISRVWVNGEPARPEDAVGPDDEVAILPPVSGG